MFCTFWLQKCFSPQRRAILAHQMFEKCSETDVVCTFLLQNVVFATSSCNFVDIRTPKSDSERKCFVHFHFQMCFSPQRRAIFRHQNFKKCSDTVCFLAFSLPNVLFATAACNFWFLLWAPTSAPAALTGLLLDWPDTRIIEKTQHFATSLTFGADVSSFFWLSRYCIFFLLTWLLYSAFQLSILSEVCYLNFLRRILLLRWIKQLHNQSTLFWWWGHSMPARHQAYSAACWSSISQTRSKIATTRVSKCHGLFGWPFVKFHHDKIVISPGLLNGSFAALVWNILF